MNAISRLSEKPITVSHILFFLTIFLLFFFNRSGNGYIEIASISLSNIFMIFYLLLNPLSKNIFKGSLGIFFLYLCLNFIIKLFSGLNEIVYEVQSIIGFLFATSIFSGVNRKRFLAYLYYFYLFNVLIVLLLNSPPYYFIDYGFIDGQRTNIVNTLCLMACLLLSNN